MRRRTGPDRYNLQSLQEKIGATAEQIRKAIEKVGFDREKVEQYIEGHNVKVIGGITFS